jgi:hypothetical protein
VPAVDFLRVFVVVSIQPRGRFDQTVVFFNNPLSPNPLCSCLCAIPYIGLVSFYCSFNANDIRGYRLNLTDLRRLVRVTVGQPKNAIRENEERDGGKS